IFTITKLHTYYVQYLCNKIYSSGEKNINIETVKRIYFEILKENEVYYSEYRYLLTRQQWKLLIALANEDGINKVSTSDFIKRHDLSNAATIRRGIKSLIDKKMIYKKERDYYVQDVFLAKWLTRIDIN
ncbi:MAG: ATP-binding protein, partial [Bacteroidetes bacterium]